MLYKLNLKLIRFFQSFFYALYVLTFRFISSFFLKIKVVGKENIPKNRTFILAANHQNFFDGFFLANAMGISLRFNFIIAKRALRNGLYCFMAKLIGQELIGDGIEEYSRALKRLKKLLLHGHNVGIFPEGNVSNHEMPRAFKAGVAKLSLDTRVGVLPVYISGTYNLRYFDYWLKSPEIKIIIGKPVDLYDFAPVCGNNLEKIASVLRDKIIELKEQQEKIKEVILFKKTTTSDVGTVNM